MFYTYIVECKDRTYYIGSTNDLKRRIHRHNTSKSGAHYTKIRRPVVLRYFESFKTYSEARKREGELKNMTRKQKMELFLSKPFLEL